SRGEMETTVPSSTSCSVMEVRVSPYISSNFCCSDLEYTSSYLPTASQSNSLRNFSFSSNCSALVKLCLASLNFSSISLSSSVSSEVSFFLDSAFGDSSSVFTSDLLSAIGAASLLSAVSFSSVFTSLSAVACFAAV